MFFSEQLFSRPAVLFMNKLIVAKTRVGGELEQGVSAVTLEGGSVFRRRGLIRRPRFEKAGGMVDLFPRNAGG